MFSEYNMKSNTVKCVQNLGDPRLLALEESRLNLERARFELEREQFEFDKERHEDFMNLEYARLRPQAPPEADEEAPTRKSKGKRPEPNADFAEAFRSTMQNILSDLELEGSSSGFCIKF